MRKINIFFLTFAFWAFLYKTRSRCSKKKKTKKTLNLRENDIGKVVNAFTHKLVQKEKPTS